MDTLVERPYAIDLSRLMKFDPRSLTWLPCLMIIAVVIRTTIDISVLEWQVVSYVALFFSMLSFFIMAFVYLRQGILSRLVLATVVFQTLMLMSSIIEGSDIKNCFYDGCSVIFIVMTCEYYSNRFKLIVVSFAVAFSICAYLNIFHMLLHPDLWIVTDMKSNQGYLLGGNYNGMGCRLLCAVTTSVVCLKYSRWWWLNVILVVLVSLVPLMLVQSMTSISGIILFLLFCLIPSKKIMKAGMIVLMVSIVFFQVFVCFQGKGIEQNAIAVYLVEDILGKDITFTNRTMLWDAASRVFADSPIYGYGLVDRDWYFSHMSSYAKGPHNFIWSILIYGGILLLATFIYICYIVISELFHTSNRYTLIICSAAVSMFLMMLMEAYPPFFIVCLLSLAYYSTSNDKLYFRTIMLK